MPKRNLTSGEVALFLNKYETANHEVPNRTLMGVFAISTICRIKTIEEVLQRPLGHTPTVHRSWFWHECLIHSGLGHLWEPFRDEYNHYDGSLASALRLVKRNSTKDEWDILSLRQGSAILRDSPLNPSNFPEKSAKYSVWTAGGVWDRRNGFTKIIVLGETPERESPHTGIQKRMTPFLSLVDREVHALVDPERVLFHDARIKAIAHAREKFSSLVGWKERKIGERSLSWYFGSEFIHRNDGWDVCYRHSRKRLQRTQNSWLPPTISKK